MSEERWLPVAISGFEHAYEVSDHGRIKTVARITTRLRKVIKETTKKPVYTQTVHERILSPGDHPFGYKIVCLKAEGKKKMERIHKLVAQAFIPNPLGLPMVNHIDSNGANNHYTNLEWCDQRYNMGYASSQGRMQKKLTWEKVSLIRAQFAARASMIDLAERFEVTKQSIWGIVRNKTWIMQGA